jgi:hypothetical protein
VVRPVREDQCRGRYCQVAREQTTQSFERTLKPKNGVCRGQVQGGSGRSSRDLGQGGSAVRPEKIYMDLSASGLEWLRIASRCRQKVSEA